jgi:hypothetical protein
MDTEKISLLQLVLNSFDAKDGQVRSISVSGECHVLNLKFYWMRMRVGSRGLKKTNEQREEIARRLIAIFKRKDIRPEVRDELWEALGLNVEIKFSSRARLPASLVKPYYHHLLIKRPVRIQTGSKTY